MAGVVEIENWYWIPDNEDYLVPGLLTETNSKGGLFRLENGKDTRKTTQEMQGLQMLDSQCLEKSISNLIELHHLTENAVLYVLRNRFREDYIYTFVSSILVAVNPFREIPIYGNDWIERYRSTSDKRGLPPHIFVVADNAYNALIRNYLSQSVVISGESGSGKTESIKLILKYITHIARKNSSNHRNIQDQILQANPVMEAFGNAKTSRNNNSSRFGKLITLRFSGGAIDEAGIISYLLEKCRVAQHAEGERNFHIFYQLIAATIDDTEFARYLGMTNPNVDYAYARRDEVGSVATINDLEGFHEVSQALKVLGVTDSERKSIFRVVAGVLLLGNIEFNATSTAGDAAARLHSVSSLEFIADSLGLSFRELQRCFTSRNFGVRSIVTCMFTVPQAIDARDAFAKKLYSLLFDWLIAYINSTLRSHGKRSDVFIAILDIFGFEAFEMNSFEQLLINYCNEKLQFHFNNYIFLMEQQEYSREGVNVSVISYIDNSATLELLERKGAGILSMVDEEISVPKGTDDTLLNKIFKTHGSHPNVKRAKPVGGDNSFRNKFIVCHYAGEVAYTITGFLDKNKDTVSPDLYQIGLTSTDPFVQELFLRGADDGGSGGRKNVSASAASKKTLGGQFKTQLASLIDTLNQTEPHFVRCMKSNMEKVGRRYDSRVMLTQLRYSGLIEVCRIRQNGFPNRLTFDKFLRTYWMLHSSSKTAPELAKSLERNGFYTSDQYFIGHTKIFLKFETGLLLEQARNHQVGACAIKFQRIIRGWMARHRLHKKKVTLKLLKAAIESRNINTLQESINSGIENLLQHTPLFCQAKLLLERRKQENNITDLLSNALLTLNLTYLIDAVKKAKLLDPPFDNPLIEQCQNKINEIQSLPENSIQPSHCFPLSPNAPFPPPPPPPKDSKNAVLQSESSNNLNGKDDKIPPPPLDDPEQFLIPPPPPIDDPNLDDNNNNNPPPPPRLSFNEERVSDLTMDDDDENKDNDNFDSERSRLKEKVEFKRQESRSLSPVSRINRVEVRPLASFMRRSKSPPPILESKDFTEKLPDSSLSERKVSRTVITRRVSQQELDEMKSLHEALTTLVEASNTEEGVNESQIAPLEEILNTIKLSGNDISNEASQLMLANEELIRAKQQLELQRKLSDLGENAPRWKVRNRLQQAGKLGMSNFSAVKKHRQALFGNEQSK